MPDRPIGRVADIDPNLSRKIDDQFSALLEQCVAECFEQRDGILTVNDVQEALLADPQGREIIDQKSRDLAMGQLRARIATTIKRIVVDEFDRYVGPRAFAIKQPNGTFLYKRWSKLTGNEYEGWRSEKQADIASREASLAALDRRFDNLRVFAQQHPAMTFEELHTMSQRASTRPARRPRTVSRAHAASPAPSRS